MADPESQQEGSPSDDEMGYHPNMQTSGVRGLICFKDVTRPCGPDCMAYLPQPPEGVQYQGAQWAHCHLLVNSERVGRHAVIATTQLIELVKLQKSAAAAAVRTQKPPTV